MVSDDLHAVQNVRHVADSQTLCRCHFLGFDDDFLKDDRQYFELPQNELASPRPDCGSRVKHKLVIVPLILSEVRSDQNPESELQKDTLSLWAS